MKKIMGIFLAIIVLFGLISCDTSDSVTSSVEMQSNENSVVTTSSRIDLPDGDLDISSFMSLVEGVWVNMESVQSGNDGMVSYDFLWLGDESFVLGTYPGGTGRVPTIAEVCKSGSKYTINLHYPEEEYFGDVYVEEWKTISMNLIDDRMTFVGGSETWTYIGKYSYEEIATRLQNTSQKPSTYSQGKFTSSEYYSAFWGLRYEVPYEMTAWPRIVEAQNEAAKGRSEDICEMDVSNENNDNSVGMVTYKRNGEKTLKGQSRAIVEEYINNVLDGAKFIGYSATSSMSDPYCYDFLGEEYLLYEVNLTVNGRTGINHMMFRTKEDRLLLIHATTYTGSVGLEDLLASFSKY